METLNENQIPWLAVEPVFDWESPAPKKFMTIVDICKAAGFTPRPGDGISVSGLLRRKGIQRLKSRGERGAMMPPLTVAKTTSLA